MAEFSAQKRRSPRASRAQRFPLMPTSAWKALKAAPLPQERAEAADVSNASTGGGDIQYKIALVQEGLSGAEKSRLYGEILINPKEALKSTKKQQRKTVIPSKRMNCTLSTKWNKPVHS